MTDRVDAAVKYQKSHAFQPVCDRVPVDTGFEELRARNYAVLPIGQRRDRTVERPAYGFARMDGSIGRALGTPPV